jgi:cytochrome b
VAAIKAANLVLRFVLEVCALAAVADWGAQVSDSTAVNVVVAIAAPLALAVFWGTVLSPKARFRPEQPARTLAELVVLALAAAALFAVDAPVLAVMLVAAAVLNGLLLHVWRQDPADFPVRARA